MANKNKNRDTRREGGQRGEQANRDRSIGNQQGTTQTGAQNAGGRQRDAGGDTFDDDLRKSGNRTSSGRRS